MYIQIYQSVQLRACPGHADPGENSGGTVHYNHLLSRTMYHPDVYTVLAYVPSQLMYHPDVCTIPTYVPSRRM